MRWAVLGAVLLLAGCGGGGHAAKQRVETIPGDGAFPPVTVTVSGPTAAACGNAADTYASQARLYLAHMGPDASYPADLYYLNMRDALRDYQVRGCASSILGRLLAARFTKRQLESLLADLPRTMAPVIHAGLDAGG
jgi:hypothetical protein